MKPLYITGGTQKPVGLKARQEWELYEKAIILRVDPECRTIERVVEYVTPPPLRPDRDSSISFEGGTVEGDRLYTCTRTETLVYRLPDFGLVNHLSLPCFNDVHHVRPTPEGNVIVTNTGLDMVLESTLDGKIVNEWGVLGESPWVRFSREVDYRKVPTTKPHGAHPNYTFVLDGELWVTRCHQSDAICLTQNGRRIQVGGEVCHDGEVRDGKIYFTTVNGTIVVVDAKTLQTQTVVDLKQIDNPGNAILGWCRGLLVVDENHVWVGFTRLRTTKFKENVKWVKSLIKGEEKPSHIALYDISAQRRLMEIDLEPAEMHMVFGILPAHGA